MKKNILQVIVVVLAGFLMAWISEAAPRYKIDSGSDMTAPPAIGAATPSTGKFTGGTFDFIGVTHMSLTGMLSTSALRVGDSRAGDMLGFIGDGQSSLVKSGPTGYVLKSGGVGVMPRWETETAGSPDWTAPGTIGSIIPNTGKFTTLRSTTGLSVDAGGITSVATEAAGGSGILGQADSGAAVSNASRLGYFFLGGAKDASSTMNNSAGMSAYATQSWSGSAAGTKLQFEVTPNGSTTRSTAVTIDQDGTATFVASKHTSLAANTSMTIAGRALTAWVPAHNILVNSEFVGDVHPSQTSTTTVRTDDTYPLDMWNFYTTGSAYNYIGSTVATVNKGTYRWAAVKANSAAYKGAMVQIVENALTVPVQGQKVSLSFAAQYVTAAPTGAINGGILCSTATADAPNAVYSSGAVPTLGTAWTLIASVATNALTTDFVTYYLENVAIPNACNNIAVAFWNSTAEASGVIWQIANPKLEMGVGATPYMPDASAVARTKLYRYVWHGNKSSVMGSAVSSTQGHFGYSPPVQMLCAPAVSLANGTGGVSLYNIKAGTIQNTTSAASVGISGVAEGYGGVDLYVYFTGFSTLTAGDPHLLWNAAPLAYLNYVIFTCEL